MAATDTTDVNRRMAVVERHVAAENTHSLDEVMATFGPLALSPNRFEFVCEVLKR